MKIVIPGGSGQVGTVLARAFSGDGHDVVVLSRETPSGAQKPAWRVVPWDARTPGPWEEELEGADAVINLAGCSVNCRYNPENRRIIKESRVDSTRLIGEAIARCQRPPRVWLQASTATIYAHRYDAPNDEATGLIGGSEPGVPDTWNFSIDVATSWERAAEAARTPGTRQVLLRSAITMNPDPGSAFDVLLGLVRCGLGGTEGDGRQFVSWIHEDDFVRAVRWVLDREEFSGPVNLAAPHPLPNREFLRDLRRAAGVPLGFGLPATKWMLEIGAFFLRTETELILKSRRVLPTRLLSSGFGFRFSEWREAAHDLCQRWKKARGNRR